jgi:hypothetical protein
MSLDIMSYQPVGDKKNSDFFNEYRLKIYQRRKSSGLEELLEHICALVVQVETGDALAYIEELYLMTPYRFRDAYLNETHKIYILEGKTEWPSYVVLEPLNSNFSDDLTRLNMLYPLASKKPNARYVGEVFRTDDLDETRNILESHSIRFHYPDETENKFFSNRHFNFTLPSSITGNRIGYMPTGTFDQEVLELGQKIILRREEIARLDRAEAASSDKGIDGLILGVDHMATRILSGEREDAILEFLTLSNYYFWGAYNIADQNSSTNVNRNPNVTDDKYSPAKVFTANNTPSFINTFENLPMPTEDFVRNFGRRMHHIAYEVKDGDHLAGEKNIDFVVNTLKNNGIPFLAGVVGECTDKPNLKQIFSKHSEYSLLITEYVERCYGFDGFFTKDNVAALTEAAGADERYHHGNIFD